MNEFSPLPLVEPVTVRCDIPDVEPSREACNHHPMGMSAWPALLTCNAFEKAPHEHSEYTGRGKAVHKAVADALCGMNVPLATLPPEDLETAQWFARWTMDSGLPWEVERRVEFTRGPLKGVFGTADLICVDEDGIIHVADFKTFSRADDAVDSFPQLAGYAVAFSEELPRPGEVVGVELTILHGGVKRAETRHMTPDQCTKIALEFVACTDAAKRGDYRRAVSAHCKYCKHHGACKGCAEIVKAAVVDTTSALCIIGRTEQELVKNPALAARVWCVAKAVEGFIEALEPKVKAAAEANGGIIEDAENGVKYGFRAASGARKCRNVPGLYDGVFKTRMTPEKFMALVSVPFGAARDALKECGGFETIKELEAMLDPYFERGEGSRPFVRLK